MSEQYMDTSGILGVLPHAEDPADADQESTDQLETEADQESDDPGQDQDVVDASDDDLQSDDDADDSEGDDKQQDDPGDDPEGWKRKYELAERDRRGWQSKANSSDADLGKALDALQGSASKTEPAQPPVSKAMEKLDSLDGEDLLDASTVKEILGNFMAEQQAEKDTAQQKNKLDDFNSKMVAELKAKPDLREVTEYFKQHLSNAPEAAFMTDVGLYHFAKAKMLESQNTEAFNKGKTEGAKDAAGRTKRLKKMPGLPGTQGERVSTQNDPSGLLNHLMQSRKARGIRKDGSIR